MSNKKTKQQKSQFFSVSRRTIIKDIVVPQSNKVVDTSGKTHEILKSTHQKC